VKTCPTCGCDIADAASACQACEAWAAALIEPHPADGAPATSSRRHLTLIAAAVAAVALTGFALSARGGAPPNASGVAAAPAAHVAPPAPPATAETAMQTWSTENQASWLDGRRRGAAFELLSENIVKTTFGPARPTLVIRCESQRIEAFVVTGSPMRIDPRVEGKSVMISVDGEPIRKEHWADSDDRKAVFAPDAAAFTQRLRTARTLHFGYSPHNSSDVVAQFHVPGIDGLLGAAARHCGATK
jgi:hypothetical protein